MAHGLIFFVGGTETTSSAIAFTLYELCMNPDIQDKLRSEIVGVISSKGFNYESLQEMKYLEMCVQGKQFFHIIQQLNANMNATYHFLQI